MIHSFSGPPLGELPAANPIVDASGRLYGTTERGGTNSACGSGCGTIYQLARGAHGPWKETRRWSFDLTHGAYPDDPLVSDSAGNFFGTTQVGGGASGLGVAYGLFHGTHGWQLRDLHVFLGNRDGQQPRSSMIFDKTGNLYGTTAAGGSGGSGGSGTVYELIRSGRKWTERISYRFPPYYSKNGANPQAPVAFGRDGSLYGTTSYGGNSACPSGCGVAFKLTAAAKGGWTESVLHAFSGSEGCTSVAGLVADHAGNFFGSTNLGGPSFPTCEGGCGTLFELAHGSHGYWSFAVIHDFAPSDGCGPVGNMAFDAAGNLYGTAVIGGNGGGVVFKIARKPHNQWQYTVLHSFTNTPDGWEPTGLIMAANGKLYGTTIVGGALGLGALFEVTP
ncbi:MAG TPA: choice-of-anchor tandem repeat GloVer-containing protein [Candidatus Cybelea sp.]